MLKKISVFLLFVLIVSNLYANNCELVNYKNGKNGLIEFKCDEKTSLKGNKVIFYIVGDKTEIDNIRFDDGKVNYKVNEVSSNIKRIKLNIVVESIIKDLDFEAQKNQIIKLKIESEKDADMNYQILWGGVIKNSYSYKKSRGNRLQFYVNKSGKFFAYEDGLECSIKDDCEDQIKISKDCSSQLCKKLNQRLGIYSDFGMVHQKII